MENKMTNVREKLSKSREMCPGLSEHVYALADYMSENANDELVPMGLCMALVLCMDDVKKGRNGFTCAKSKELPEHLSKNKMQVLAQAVYIPQIIDAIADKAFAEEFRGCCKNLLNMDPPKRTEKFDLTASIDGNYPEYIVVAVNWWANALQNPKFDNGDDTATPDSMAFLMRMLVNEKHKITDDQLNLFKKSLADKLLSSLESSSSIYFGVDYHPDKILYDAAETAGIDDDMGFPWKTSMNVSAEEVSVSAGYGADKEILWRKIS